MTDKQPRILHPVRFLPLTIGLVVIAGALLRIWRIGHVGVFQPMDLDLLVSWEALPETSRLSIIDHRHLRSSYFAVGWIVFMLAVATVASGLGQCAFTAYL